MTTMGFEAIWYPGFCKHLRAEEYFISSIENSNCFMLAHECSSFYEFKKGIYGNCGKCKSEEDPSGVDCVPMGEDVDLNVKLEGKKLFLYTAKQSPYCCSTNDEPNMKQCKFIKGFGFGSVSG